MRSPSDLHARLRREVGLLRARESRRVFDPILHVGEPAGERASTVVPARDLPAFDIALRTDVVSRLLEERPRDDAGVSAWLARPGVPELHDRDLEWLAAALLASGQHGLQLVRFYAVTRAGWLDVRSGDRRTWKRLRL